MDPARPFPTRALDGPRPARRLRWRPAAIGLAASLLLPFPLHAQPFAAPALVLAVLLASTSWAYLPAALLVAGRSSWLVGAAAALCFAAGLVARDAPGLLPWLAAAHAGVGLALTRLRARNPTEANAWWAWAGFHAGVATWA